jgi:hypothetical protein
MSDPYNQTPQGSTSHHKTHSQRNSSLLDKTKQGGKAAFDKGWGWFEKLGAPVNKLTNKIGSEAFWPTTLDHESDKSARILKSFCSEYPIFVPSPNWSERLEGITQKTSRIKRLTL